MYLSLINPILRDKILGKNWKQKIEKQDSVEDFGNQKLRQIICSYFQYLTCWYSLPIFSLIENLLHENFQIT